MQEYLTVAIGWFVQGSFPFSKEKGNTPVPSIISGHPPRVFSGWFLQLPFRRPTPQICDLRTSAWYYSSHITQLKLQYPWFQQGWRNARLGTRINPRNSVSSSLTQSTKNWDILSHCHLLFLCQQVAELIHSIPTVLSPIGSTSLVI